MAAVGESVGEVLGLVEVVCDLLVEYGGAQGDAGVGEAFGQDEDVGDYVPVFVGEEFACSAASGYDLV